MKQFLSISEAAQELGTSEQHIRNLVRGIRSHPERYTESDIFGRSKVAVRFVALQDFANYGRSLRSAPPYRPTEREKELGIVQYTIDNCQMRDVAKQIVKEVIDLVCKAED